MPVTHLPGTNGRTLCGAILAERHKHRIVRNNPACKACANGGTAPQSHLDQDWSKVCSVCWSTPVVPETGMCGPCTFGEADTIGGNW